MPEVSLPEWKKFLASHPNAHLLQTGEWGELKSAFGWSAVRLVSDNIGAQILFRGLPLGITIAYIPKGPVARGDISTNLYTENSTGFWAEVDNLCKSCRAVFLKIEPDAWEAPLSPSPSIGAANIIGLKVSRHPIQPRRTIFVDLRGNEEDILARMKQKCRYNIRLAEKKQVTVRPWDDIDGFHRMMTITSERDTFGVHSKEYYQRAYNLFRGSGVAEMLVAEYEGNPLAALMVCARGRSAWYLYGASTDEERNRMPAYLLQWEAMLWAKKRGAEEYDLWGIPDEENEVLESNFETRKDGLWGVYRFKRGFGGIARRAVAPLDKVFNPLVYSVYLKVISKRGRSL